MRNLSFAYFKMGSIWVSLVVFSFPIFFYSIYIFKIFFTQIFFCLFLKKNIFLSRKLVLHVCTLPLFCGVLFFCSCSQMKDA